MLHTAKRAAVRVCCCYLSDILSPRCASLFQVLLNKPGNVNAACQCENIHSESPQTAKQPIVHTNNACASLTRYIINLRLIY